MCKYFFYYVDEFGVKREGCRVRADKKCFYILPTLMGCPDYEPEGD